MGVLGGGGRTALGMPGEPVQGDGDARAWCTAVGERQGAEVGVGAWRARGAEVLDPRRPNPKSIL